MRLIASWSNAVSTRLKLTRHARKSLAFDNNRLSLIDLNAKTPSAFRKALSGIPCRTKPPCSSQSGGVIAHVQPGIGRFTV